MFRDDFTKFFVARTPVDAPRCAFRKPMNSVCKEDSLRRAPKQRTFVIKINGPALDVITESTRFGFPPPDRARPIRIRRILVPTASLW